MKSNRTICDKANQDPNMPCYDSYSMTMNGTQSRVYQKVVEMGEASNPFASFSVNFNLSASNTTSCNFSSSFSIVDSKYLTARPHLTQNVSPSVLEKALLKGFATWMKSQLDVMEGK